MHAFSPTLAPTRQPFLGIIRTLAGPRLNREMPRVRTGRERSPHYKRSGAPAVGILTIRGPEDLTDVSRYVQ